MSEAYAGAGAEVVFGLIRWRFVLWGEVGGFYDAVIGGLCFPPVHVILLVLEAISSDLVSK